MIRYSLHHIFPFNKCFPTLFQVDFRNAFVSANGIMSYSANTGYIQMITQSSLLFFNVKNLLCGLCGISPY